VEEKNELTDAQKDALQRDGVQVEISESQWDTIKARSKEIGVIEAVKEITAPSVEPTPPAPQAPPMVDTPEFARAFQVVMDLFVQFIILEKDAPDEPRLLLFPAFMHITKEEIDKEIVALYGPNAKAAAIQPAVVGIVDLEDIKIIQEGISDAISILKKRTAGAFPSPGTRALNQLEYESLSELAWTQTVTFYRIGEADLVRGHVRLSSEHTMQANQPPGTRVRSWVAVREFTKLFFDVLAAEEHEDIIADLIEKDAEIGAGYSCYFLRWREADLV